MPLADLDKLPGSFGYKLCALYLPQRYDSSTMSEALRMLVDGLGKKWRDAATFDDVCLELEYVGVGHADTTRSLVLVSLSEDVERENSKANDAGMWIADRNRKLGAWVACACAREALRFVPSSEERPLQAIETTEAWVRGEATKEQVRIAHVAASTAASDADRADAPAYAAGAAAAAAYVAAARSSDYSTYATEAAAEAASDAAAARAASLYSAAWYAVRNAELRRLVSVIAASLQTFPVLMTAPE